MATNRSAKADWNWMRLAACRGADADFFPENEEDAGPALAVCGLCPVRPDCLRHGLRNKEDGVWGGTTPAQRRRLVRRRGWAGPEAAPRGHLWGTERDLART